jgi:deazaflavin-dependent oxidoreductase (nitroreductase family)
MLRPKLEGTVAKKYTLTGSTRAFNGFARGLIRLGVPTGNIALLTVPGRQTGQPRSTVLNLHVENGRRYLVSPYGHVGWVQNVRAAGGRARLKSRGRTEDVRLQELPPTQSPPILKYYAEHFKVVTPYFDAKPGDPVERFAAEAGKHPVFEILPS